MGVEKLLLHQAPIAASSGAVLMFVPPSLSGQELVCFGCAPHAGLAGYCTTTKSPVGGSDRHLPTTRSQRVLRPRPHTSPSLGWR
ncbi:hypothetical protein B0T26DRAFT_46738 [Lasiosphaeria miniovina]|uniref:Uncharacterized protein n=1 Tax=Lasiosphaeria miniovina TaxID=1954250 RepID=A0AA40BGT9_9PEZI|nr:uncharacterized protein B0T26DRAFT_46738 [Lasiosphaeria miniovina]KAK0733978.1 hypothetical protein B0T26DRAFT_46738 [Lasiosphaeria miniovina]